MPTTRKCAANDCNLQVAGNQLMCWEHWRNVPARVQADVTEQLYSGKTLDQAEQYLRGWLKDHQNVGAE